MAKKLKEELTAKMHSEFTISKETGIEHRAGVVWGQLPVHPKRSEVEELCKLYGITYEQAMKYKAEWQMLIRNSIDRNL